MIAYRIKNWDKYFEKADTRKCKTMSWVAIPNKHDGASYRQIAAHEYSVEIFAGWILIVQAASKMPVRGLLYKDRPVTATDLAYRTGFPQRIFELALATLANPQIGWLETVDIESIRKFLEISGSFGTTGQDRTEQLKDYQ